MSENKEPRTYGQGAQGEPDAPIVVKVSLRKRLRYNFDNSLSKAGAFVGYVFLAIIVLAFVMTTLTAIIAGFKVLTDPLPADSYFIQYWAAFTKILGTGSTDAWALRSSTSFTGASALQSAVL